MFCIGSNFCAICKRNFNNCLCGQIPLCEKRIKPPQTCNLICPKGATGPTGATECPFLGNFVLNSGMEQFTANIPTDWTSTTSTKISQVGAQGRVHTGQLAVNIEDGGVLTQVIDEINPGCIYEFSFFARGEGVQVGVVATVNFITPGGDVLGAEILVRQHDLPDSNRNFQFYTTYTNPAPLDVSSARIDFVVTANGAQSMDLDDVIFS